MSLTELLPALKDLSSADKLEALQFLGQELADDAQGRPLLAPYFANWSPREISREAGQAIMAALEEDKRAKVFTHH